MVIGIITCNRIEHLKKCIESLEKTIIANDSILYISVDYPPSENYMDGYYKVCNYLKNGLSGLKKVNVFYQKENLGHELNCYWLEDKIFEEYDSFIYTEDDNVFSGNSLVYFNESIKNNNDKNCYAICGHNYPVEFKYKDNNVVRMYNDFDAWGYAVWKDKTIEARKYILSQNFIDMSHNLKMMKKLLKMNTRLFCYYVDNLYHKVEVMKSNVGITRVFDITLAIYCIFFDKYNLVPVVNKVRNDGWDGSGFNCPEGTDEYKWSKQPLDDEMSFEYKYNEKEDDIKNNIQVMKEYHHENLLHVLKRIVMLMMYNIKH